ncbi:MAG TPA: TonB family protein [Thermoanaerobaculia bacterium]|nr:TonB family protein [Thermoanaerobaculia bacterium]
MAARNKPFESFGPYILFKKLEADSLGDLWRAGRIENGQLGPIVALRRLTGGNRPAIAANAEAVAALLPQLTGTSFAREQSVGVIDGVPYLAYSYAAGRSLRHIIDRGRGGNGVSPNPLPLDQAIVIAEKVALSLATSAELRDGSGARLSHGALVPQFIWISDDGEIRVAGQQLGAGLIASMSDPKVAADVGRYFSPESRSGTQTKNADVYSLGAILFLLVTGQEPPDASTASAFGAAVRAAKTLTGAPVPDDIRVILDKSFNIDPSMRYATIGDMKQAISALAHGGKYSASTFNLAFYLSNLLKKEMESEAIDREKESKVNVAPYLEAPKGSGPARVEHAPLPAMFTAAEEPKTKSKLPLAIAAVVVLAAAGVGGWWVMKNRARAPVTQVAAAQVVPAPQQPRVISEPVVASASTSTAPATSTAADPDAQKKLFEEAVARKLQQEMMKMQSDFIKDLKTKEAKNAPAVAAPVPVSAPAPEERAPSAAQLDQQRREAAPQRQEQVAEQAPAPAVTQTQAPAPAPQQAAPAPAPAAAAVREGDVVDVLLLDQVPKPVKPIAPVYPLLARQQRIAARIVLTAFINEQGNVTDVRVLQGDARFGLNDAAIRAMRAARFSPPVKDGKRVKTWFPQAIEFRP